MKVLVCGGRDFNDYELLDSVLNSVSREGTITCIIHGCARGADSLAEKWANSRRIKCIGVPALWKSYGKSAGILRNQKMLDDEKPDLIVAFPGGRGTQDMKERAARQGFKVISIASNN